MSNNSLPAEILIEIFGYVNTLAQLCQCRLVCAEWYRIASPSVLGRPIVLNSSEEALRLYHHLKTYPENGKLIKKLSIDNYPWYIDQAFTENCWDLFALTPNLTVLEGEVDDDACYGQLLKLITNQKNKLSKLAVIPHPNFDPPFEYTLLVPHLKDRLQEIYISLRQDDDNRKLDEFKCLKSIVVGGNVNCYAELDRAIDSCHSQDERRSLDKLKFYHCEPPFNEIAVDLPESSNKFDSLKLLQAKNFGAWPNCVQYAAQKFSKIETAIIDMTCIDENQDQDQEQIKYCYIQVLDALQKVPVYDLMFYDYKEYDIKECILDHINYQNGTVIFKNNLYNDTDTHVHIRVRNVSN
ncbi:hypothetical protein BD408DRAFT_469084, partial [Parasitella parasitica]